MGTIAEKLTYLDGTKTLIKGAINNAGANITNDTFRSYATTLGTAVTKMRTDRDTLVGNSVIGTSTGSISGALNYPLNELKMTKESTQETTQGNQLFNFNTSNYLTYGSVNVSGKADDFTIEGVGTYDLRAYCVGLINYNTLYKYMTSEYAYLSMSVYITDNETYSTWNDYANARTQINADWNTNSLDLSNYQGKYLWIQLRGGNGTTYSSVNYKNFVLSKTSVSSYEPYTGGIASPSPSYPQEVKTVKGYRNLFDFDNIVYSTLNSSTIIKNNKTYTITCGNSEFGALKLINDDLKLKPNTTYILSAKVISTTSPNGSAVYCSGVLNITGQKYGSYAQAGQISSVTFTTPSTIDGTVLALGLYPRQSNGTATFGEVQIVEGTEKLPYVPYGTNWIYTTISDGTNTKNIPIPLNDNEIVGKSTNLDELIIDKNGHCWINKKFIKIDSYNGETITTDYWSTTGGLDTGATIYYVASEPTLIDLNYNVDLTLFNGINNITNSEDMTMAIKYVEDIETILGGI